MREAREDLVPPGALSASTAPISVQAGLAHSHWISSLIGNLDFFPSCHREFNKHSRVGEWVEAIKQSTAELIPPEGAETELCRAGTGEHKPW